MATMQANDIVDFQLQDDESENTTRNNDTRIVNRRCNSKVLKISGPALLVILLVVIISIVLRDSRSEENDQHSVIEEEKSEKIIGGTTKTISAAEASTSTTDASATKLAFENVSTIRSFTTTAVTNSSSFGTTDFDPFTEVATVSTALPTYPKPSLMFTTNDLYIIMSNLDGFVMDVDHYFSNHRSAVVGTWRYLHGSNQHFRLDNLNGQLKTGALNNNNSKLIEFNLMNRHRHTYVGRDDVMQGNYYAVVIRETDTFPNERWTLYTTAEVGVVQIRDENGSKCLVNPNDINNPSQHKIPLRVTECTSDSSSEWRILRFCQFDDWAEIYD